MTENKNLIVNTIEDVMHNSMIPYAEYVIMDRALPRVEDGLKPVQRRILYSMYEQGMTHDKPHKKSARVVGDCLAKYHPHGDSSVYDAMVRMAQNFNMRMTLVDGHGNFGSIDGDTAAAMRYTEVRLTSLASTLLTDIDKDTVDWSLNFDDSLKEPTTLPSRYPNLLVNGSSGIAVGLATNIPPHNLKEVIDGTIHLIDNPNASVNQIMKFIKGPDFPTGGYIIAGDELKKAYETGRGKVTMRAKFHVEDAENGKKNIVITEIPYGVNKASLLDKISTVVDDKGGVLENIIEINDESDRLGMRAVLKVKKDSDIASIMEYLFKQTNLSMTFGINMVAIADGRPQQMGLCDLLKYYIAYQIKLIVRRTKFDLDKAKERAHILEGLIIASDNIDKVIKIIKTSKDTPTAKEGLIKAFKLSARQAQAILDLRLSKITKLEVFTLKDEHKNLLLEIERLASILASKDKQKQILKTEITEIKDKYKDIRKSQIVDSHDEVEQNITSTISAEQFIVGITGINTIRKIKQTQFNKAINNSDISLSQLYKQHLSTNSDETLLIFTNKGNCIKTSIDNIIESRGLMGKGNTLFEMFSGTKKDEFAVSIIAVNEDTDLTQNLVFVTKGGAIKLTSLDEYLLQKTSFVAIKLKDDDTLASVEIQKTDSQLLFITEKGNGMNTTYNDIPVQGRIASGVVGMKLSDGDSILNCHQLTAGAEELFVVVSSLNTFKKVYIDSVPLQKRGGKGVRVCDFGGNDIYKILYTCCLNYNEDIKLLVEHNEGTCLLSTEKITIESRTHKGKPLSALNGKVAINALAFYKK